MLVRMMAEQEAVGEAEAVGVVPVVQAAAQSVVVSYPLVALRRKKASPEITKELTEGRMLQVPSTRALGECVPK